MSIKTLVKIASEKTGIPALGAIKVYKNECTATNLDVWASTPLMKGHRLKKGMYSPIGFEKGWFTDTEIPITNFPGYSDQKRDLFDFDNCGQVVFNKEKMDLLKWIHSVTCTQETRYYLNGTAFYRTKKRNLIVATDGHRLNAMSVSMKWPRDAKKKKDKQIIIPRQSMKYILDSYKNLKADNVIFYFDISKKWFFATVRDENNIGLCYFTGKTIDGTFPDIERVILDDYKDSCEINIPQIKKIKPEVLARYKAKYGYRRNDPVQSAGVKIEKNTLIMPKPFNLKWDIDANIKKGLSIGFNVNYLCNGISGKMEYKDDCSPIKITSNDNGIYQFCVIMPLRV